MRLGTETGSMTNHLYSRAVIGQPTPEVGMGATILCWTDRHAATVVVVYRGGEIVTVQEDFAKRTDTNGYGGNQEYSYSPNKNGATRSFRKAKNGCWDEVVLNPDTARWNKVAGLGLTIGKRASTYEVVLPDGTTITKRSFAVTKPVATATALLVRGETHVVVWDGTPAWLGDFGPLTAVRIDKVLA